MASPAASELKLHDELVERFLERQEATDAPAPCEITREKVTLLLNAKGEITCSGPRLSEIPEGAKVLIKTTVPKALAHKYAMRIELGKETSGGIRIHGAWNELDFALFQVDSAPPASVRLRLTPRVAINAPITVLSYPSGRHLTFSPPCVVHPNTAGGLSPAAEMLAHKCDTSGGSSGGAVFDNTTLEFVAIYNGGKTYTTYPGASLPWSWNRATFLDVTRLNTVLAGHASSL